jgi:iron complex outermembrane receptor protein
VEGHVRVFFKTVSKYLLHRRNLPGVLLFLALSGSCPAEELPPADLDTLELEELMQVEVSTVYGASRYEQELSEAPASVTIVTADEIRKQGYRDLASILEGVRGFSTSYDRNYHYAGFRGFSRPGDYGTRFLLLLDGIRVNNAVYDSLPIGSDFPLDIDLIDHVEVIRGPSQSIYGSNAFFGVINVVTKQGRDLSGGEAALAGGSYSTYGSRVSYGHKGTAWETLFSGSFSTSRGQNLYFHELDSPQFNNGWSTGNDGLRFGSAFAKIVYGDFTLEGSYGRSRKGIPTNPWGTIFDDSRASTTDTTALLGLTYQRSLPDGLDLLARVSANWYRYRGDYPYGATNPPPADSVGRDSTDGNWAAGELMVVKELWRYHKVIAGGEFRDNYRQDQSYRDESGLWYDRRSSYSLGLYLQDEIQIRDNLLLNIGGRYDYFSTSGGTFNPRLAVIYSPLDGTTLKFLCGSAFRAPNAYELYYFTDPEQRVPLREESVTSYELMLEQRLTKHLRGSVNLFLNEMRDVISQDDGSPADVNIPFANADRFESRGVEFSLKGVWPGGFRATGSYSLQTAFDEKTDTVLPNTPQQLAKLGLIVPLVRERLTLGVEEQYTGSRKKLDGGRLPGYWLTNLTLTGQEILPRLDLSASVYNLFDRSYAVPGAGEHLLGGISAIEQDGRSFRFKLTYRF